MTLPISAKFWDPEHRPSGTETFLFIVHFDPDGLSTVRDNIAAWVDASALDYEILNMWDYGPAPLVLPTMVRLDDYAGVIIHPTVCYFPHNLESLDAAITPDFARYSGIKVLAKQDEHNQSHAFARYITNKSFDILVTCVSEDQLSKVYPEPSLDGIQVVQQLTSYVSEAIRNSPTLPYDARTIDIGYRGSTQPLICGRLGFEKKQIGNAVEGPARAAGLITDISSNWDDRIHGSGWGDFLASCKSVLGVESGSNLFDFDGEVSALCAAFTSRNPDLVPDTAAFYQLAQAEFLHRYEDNVDYGQLSPRHFEAAAAGTLQILYDGRYSDILVAGRHYFSLKRDLSNLSEAIALISDRQRWTEMTQTARREIIDTDRFTYADFARRFDYAIETALENNPKTANTTSSHPPPQQAHKKQYAEYNSTGNDKPSHIDESADNWWQRLVAWPNRH